MPVLREDVGGRGPKRPVVVSLYVRDPPWSERWGKLKEICRREGTTMSEVVLELVESYVRSKEEKYNPQTAITSFLEGPVMEPPKVTCSREEFWRWVRTLPESELWRLEYRLDVFRDLTLFTIEEGRKARREG